jgi:SAM-dependent methyltransferase
VQWVSGSLLTDLWRYEFGVDVRPSFKGVRRFGLWESPTGLYFFDPMLEGDELFYAKFYSGSAGRVSPTKDRPREEFLMAARQVGAGDRVLDVGCGFGAFRHCVPHARYTGLEPHLATDPNAPMILRESLSAHLVGHEKYYDAACAFQVLEHVSAPVDMLADMARAVRPGGKVIIGVPHVPSAHTRIPNYLINAVPHHLTWWTAAALKAIASRVGLIDAAVEIVPWCRVDSILYWMERCTPVRCGDAHYRHAWAWHASALIGFLGGFAISKVRPIAPVSANDEGAGLLLVASVPDG